MRLLLLNWRDIRNPRGGGAERVTHEVARRLVLDGAEVTWLSSAAPGLPPEEVLDGIRIVRRGNEVTTRFAAPALARKVRPTIVLEEINTLPYLAPLWARVPVLLYMNQLARDVWWHEARLPISAIGWLAEPGYLRAYRSCDAVTISLSTLADLRDIGLRGTITIAPMAVEAEQARPRPHKSLSGRLVAIGRLTPSKRYDHAIEALHTLRARMPEANLTLVGDGRDADRLRRHAEELGDASALRITGRVSEQDKIEILDQSDILIGTSVREGWGLTITEAAARGAPAVVYDIPGFRDAVVPGRTGLLVQPRPQALADALERLLRDPGQYGRLAQAAWESAKSLSYDATAHAFAAALGRAAAENLTEQG